MARRWFATEDVLTPELTGEQKLALAVLHRALESDSGRGWLLTDPSGPAFWCAVAGLDLAALRDRVARR